MNKFRILELDKTGYKLGLEFSGIFKTLKRDEQFMNFNKDKEFETIKKNVEEIYSEYLEEMYGRADGLHIDRDAFLNEIFYSGFTKKEACTDIVIKVNDDEIISGHNEDLSETLDEAALIKYKKDNMFYYDFSTYNCPQGTTFGWNSNGIVISVNTIHTLEYHKQGVPPWFILRDIIFCKNIEDIKNKIERIYCTTGFSLNVVDKNLHKAYSVEKIYDNIDIIEINHNYAHTNHIIHASTKYRSNEMEDSILRLGEANRLLQEKEKKSFNLNDIKDILQFYENPDKYIYRPIGEDEYPTIATFIFNSKTDEINIYSYYDKSLIKLNYYDVEDIIKY